MRPQAPHYPNIYLKPGELCISLHPTLIETVLGSCVSITLHCPVKQIGAMCHAMLPAGHRQDHKYVDSALEHMLCEMERQRIGRAMLVAKLFGGADMFACARNMESARFPVGEQNIDMARQLLARHKIPIAKEDTGGVHGRKLLFLVIQARYL